MCPWIQIYIYIYTREMRQPTRVTGSLRSQYRRTGFKCVVKCYRLRENKLIALPIIAIANDLSHIHAHPVHVVPGSNNFLLSNDCESGKNRNSQLLAARKHFPSYGNW